MMIDTFKNVGLVITPEQEQQLKTLMEFMLEYNKNVNLTRITEYNEIIEKHYIDSILPLTMVDVPRGTYCADIGTGAGFPSLPMNIYRPDLKFTLIDSLGKRITYLDLACEKIGIKCRTIHARSEEAAKKTELREKFGFVTARAVAALNVLCEYCLPYVEKGGVFAALKGAEDECNLAENAIKKLGGEIEKVVKYQLPCGDNRNLVIIRKVSETPKNYPRAGGVIAKRPL
ncbi:MAG: 16S rRNA (guanine(527)-N(7))-methyltransferase RsmG [Ruminiclostridium sp.]|nr:16S rRNA (guanine(527)-N(7))-methyltransferase RsmG [Ruminiclostridium sp.]